MENWDLHYKYKQEKVLYINWYPLVLHRFLQPRFERNEIFRIGSSNNFWHELEEKPNLETLL